MAAWGVLGPQIGGRSVTSAERDGSDLMLVVADRVHPVSGSVDTESGRTAEERSQGSSARVERESAPQGVLHSDGVIRAVGSARRLRRRHPEASLLELPDATVTPGLTDAHMHLLEWAEARRGIDLSQAKTPAEAARLVASRGAETGDVWVRGQGWRSDLWDDLPHRRILDAEVGERPVALQSHDMHAWWLNSVALAELGIDEDTEDPPGGEIVRDEAGRATGVLLEEAGERVSEALHGTTSGDTLAALEGAQRELHRLGVTQVHSMEMPAETFRSLELLRRLEARGGLRLRVLQHLPEPFLEEATAVGLRSGIGSNLLKVGCLKLFLDGTLGCRTAWMNEPYADAPHRGRRLLLDGELRRRARAAAAAGLATAVHAIGDAAVEQAMAVLSAVPAGREAGERAPALPHRVEHAELVTGRALAAADPRRLVCSVQPAHLLSDREAAERRWGRERCHTAFRFRDLLDRGLRLLFGSDAPVERPDPLLAMAGAVDRGRGIPSPDGPLAAWYPEQRLTRREALRALSADPAAAAGLGDRAGRLVPGAPADFVAWSADPLDPGVSLPGGARCVATFVDGEMVWERNSEAV